MAASIVLAMADSAGTPLVTGAHQWARISLALLVVGPSILLIYAWVEMLNNPGLSLADGYDIGRTPYTPIGIVLSLAGGVGGLLAGSIAIVIEGGWWRRFLVVPSVVAAVLWWGTALGILPYPRFHGPDPVTFAYSLPVVAALLVLMPAAVLAALCITPRIVTAPRTRLRPVQPVERKPRAWQEADDDHALGGGDPEGRAG
jgi:hypothetical protein